MWEVCENRNVTDKMQEKVIHKENHEEANAHKGKNKTANSNLRLEGKFDCKEKQRAEEEEVVTFLFLNPVLAPASRE